MDYRHEWKHEINYPDLLILRQRMRAVAGIDKNAEGGKYEIRSLYFDNLSDKVLREKIDGVNMREKFRIRLYNHDMSSIHLEKKSRCSGLCKKEITELSAGEAQAIADGQTGWMMDSNRALVKELYCKMLHQGLKPRTIVDYTREPFVYGPGNVRVTLDYNIRTGLRCTDLLDADCITVPLRGNQMILEVKWDSFLPAVIRDAVQLPGRRTAAFSKYAACRVYG